MVIPDEYEPGSMFDGLTADRLRILLDRSGRFLEENETEIESAYQHYTDIWNDIIEELREQQIEKGLSLVLVSVVAIGATVLTFGALGPEMISVETAVLGSFALCFDVSSLTEGSLELYYGCTGDVETVAFNPIRDTYFRGKYGDENVVWESNRGRTTKYIEQLENVPENKKNHIIYGSKNSNHGWENLVPDKNWNDIKNIIAYVMDTGVEGPYKLVFSKKAVINGFEVEVTYTRLSNGTIKISDAWVNQ